ncbi:protein bark beetle-like [Corticium candelabrum]|uniref:protein bark beetle-like n=1 Tax=Corticium candelabrum TaxID=121492 RepID=UPI002E273E00|nr:protein bark beetle-like [Corticium candelabrum]
MSGSANQVMISSTNIRCHTSSWQTGIRINTDQHMLQIADLYVTNCYKGLDTYVYGHATGSVAIYNSTFIENSYRGANLYSHQYYYSYLPQTLQQTSQLQVSNCTFSGTTDTALYVDFYVYDSNSYSVHINITDNTFQQNLQALLLTHGYRDGYAIIARNNFMNNNGKCCSGAMDINDNYYYSSSIHAPVIVENNVFTYNSGEYVVRLNTRASLHSSHQHVDSLLIFRENELTNNSLSSLPTRYAESTPNAVIVLTGTGYMSVYNNILDNQNANTELAVQVEGYSSLDTMNVTLNWWGTTNEEKIVERIFDFDDRNHLAVAQYFPFLLSPSISHVASSSHPRSYPPFLNYNREVGGQLDTDLTLTASGGPYTVTRDVTVLANATLTVEAGAVLTILPYVGILIEGRILSKGTPDNPVTFTHIVNDAKNKSKSDTQLLVRFSEPVSYSWYVYGIIELQLNRLWYPLCYNSQSIDYWSFDRFALLSCQQLTYWNKHYNWYHGWWQAEWFPALGDPIVRDFWCPESATSFNNCTFNTSSYAPHSKCLQVVQVYCFCDRALCYRQLSQFTQTNWAGIRFAPTSTVPNYPFNQKTPRSVLNHTEIIGAGHRYHTTVPSVQSIFRPPQTNGLTIKGSASAAMEVSHLHEEAVISGVTIVGAAGDGLVILRPRGSSLMVEYVTVNDVAGAGIRVYDFWSLLSANVDYESICSGQTIISVDPEEGSYVGMSQDDHLPGITCSVVMQGPPNTILSVRLVSLRLYSDDTLYIRDGAQSASSLLVSYSGYRTSSSNAPVLSSSNNIYIQVTTGQKTGAPGFALFVDVIPTTGQQPVVIIKSSSIHNSQYGVYFENAYDDARIQNVTIMNVLNDGVYVYSHEGDVMVDNCTIAHTRGNGVEYRYGDGQQIVTNNRIVNVSTGIYLYYTPNNFGCHSTLSKNFISQARKNAVLHRTYRNRRRQCTIDISNNFFESNEEGVYLQNDYNSNAPLQLDFTVSNNLFSNNSGTDLFFSRNGDWNGKFNIYSNTFEQHRVGSGGCLTLQGYTTSLVSTGNLFTHNRGTYVVRIEPQTLTQSDFVFTNNTMINNYVTESDTYHRDGRSAVLIVSTSDRFLIKNNHFDNPRSLFELGVEIPVQSSQERVIDVTNNYWGTTDENIIIDRIHDFGYCSRLASAQYFPFLTSKNGPTASPSVSATLVITRPNSIVRGRVSSNTILAASGSPYVVTGDITVLPGNTLTIESGVELKFTHNTGILVEGQLIAHGNDNSPILLRDDSFAIGDLQLEEGSLRLVDGSSQWRGRVEIFHNGNWGPVCAVHNYSDWWQWWGDHDHYNSRVICRELGYSNANWQWPYVDPTLETSTTAAWLEHVLCRGDEETLRQCINYDLKKTTCRYGQLVASCSSQNVDGHYKTHKSVYHWTGVRFSAQASGKSSMRNVIISNAGIANAGHIAAVQNVGANVELFNVVVNKSAWTGIEVSHSPYINISQLTVEGSDGNGVELINTAASSITHLTSNNNVGHGLVIRVDSVLQRMWDIPVLHKQIVDICSVSKLSAASSFFLRFIATPISRGYSIQSCSATIDATSQHVISVHIMAIRFQEPNSNVTINQQNVFRWNRLEPNYPLHYTSQSQTITVDVRAEFTDERHTLEDNYFLAYIQQHPTG